MDQDVFWSRLEYRICYEMFGGYWCDGLTPSRFQLEDTPPCITGIAHICKGTVLYEEWGFTLFLPRRFASPADIEWESLLPARKVKGWVALDHQLKTLVMRPPRVIYQAEPGAAPDGGGN